MPINPWPVGQLSPITITLTQESLVVDLSSAATNQISVLLYHQNSDGSYAQTGTGAGVVTILQNKPGKIQYAPAASDVATAGNYAFRIKINWAGTTPQLFDYIPWIIQP
ncbi:MAG TPA: hypothetical protein VFQ30_05975 [Ktedonobacteraceae bacterium]|nr:hypothetical protein [Ktedonobacteraceae bacterium]